MTIAALKRMDVFELISLRDKVDARITEVRRDLEKSLSRLSGPQARGRKPAGVAKRAGHPLKGRSVAPKYRGPEGETWTGRGLKPKWLSAAIAAGSKVEDFLIQAAAKPARAARAKKK
jgi:DNA-binding protein H-NS